MTTTGTSRTSDPETLGCLLTSYLTSLEEELTALKLVAGIREASTGRGSLSAANVVALNQLDASVYEMEQKIEDLEAF